MAWAIRLVNSAEASPLAEKEPGLNRLKKGQQMARKRKIEGKAIARILDAKTQETVGYLFEWNTGEIDPKWNDEIPRDEKDVVYEYA